MNRPKRLVMAMTGRDGLWLGGLFLRKLAEKPVEVHLIVPRRQRGRLESQTGLSTEEMKRLAARVHKNRQIGAPMASGSWKHGGMVVLPCGMDTCAGLAGGSADTLVLRAADVSLKEKRPLVAVTARSHFNPIHLDNLRELTRSGVHVMSAVPPKNPTSAGETLYRDLFSDVFSLLDLPGTHSI